MKFFKHLNRSSDKLKNSGTAVFNWLSPWVSKKLRFPGRLRLAIRWSNKNPKKTIWGFLSLMIALFLLSLPGIFTSRHESQSLADEIQSMSSITQTVIKQNEQQNTRLIQAAMSDVMTNTLQPLIHERDSLMELPVKTPEDSARIVATHKKIIETHNLISHAVKD